MQIETERLILRPFTLQDVEDVYRYAQNPLVGPAAGWAPHKNREETRGIVEDFIRGGTLALEEKGTGRVIGSIGLHDTSVSRLMGCLRGRELGYVLDAAYWGRGLMTEAARAAADYAFRELGVQVLWCGYFEGNERSRRVQEKLGFVPCYRKQTFVKALNQTHMEQISFLTDDRFYSFFGKEIS